MIITPTTRTITDYSFTVSAEEAAGALTDPFSFGERIAEQLRAAGVVASTGNGASKSSSGWHKERDATFAAKGKLPRKPQAARPNASARGTRGPKAKASIECPQCGKSLTTQGFLDRHLRQKHSVPQPTATVATAE